MISLIRSHLKHTSSSRFSCSFNDDNLSKSWFWKERYGQPVHREESFDWFLPGHTLHEMIQPILQTLSKPGRPIRILDIGCGNSSLPQCLYSDSDFPVDLHLTDYVSDCLSTQFHWLKNSCKGHENTSLSLVQCDVTQLPFRTDVFNVVVDKGTTDAILKDREHGGTKSYEILKCVREVLQPGGVFIQVTDEDPDVRLGLLESCLKGSVSFSETNVDNREYFVFKYIK